MAIVDIAQLSAVQQKGLAHGADTLNSQNEKTPNWVDLDAQGFADLVIAQVGDHHYNGSIAVLKEQIGKKLAEATDEEIESVLTTLKIPIGK